LGIVFLRIFSVYGRSNNPYHLGRIVGGSSGGEAGLIAAAGSVFGIGSDVGGSIRMPAFFCGIFGHKPTTGLVSNDGQVSCETTFSSLMNYQIKLGQGILTE
jgi:Asp-tRNA(Asn)/Glu-tRNA(Gln) amidotransferase A subunit family amidase